MHQPRRTNPFPLGDANLPYSKGLMARALIAIGVSGVRAYELARRVEVDLATRDERVVELDRLQELAVDTLGPIEGREAVRRLRRYHELDQLDLPIILLLGGATGTGKSTVATEAGYRLGITRLTSTDFIRQTMRAFFSEEFMPTVHHSSFEAWRGLPEPEQEEGWSMVLEGVHLVPGMLPPDIEGALVVPVILAVEHEEVHAANFFVRDAASDGVRPVDKYLEGLDDIRLIQDFIVRQARKHGVPVIDNGNIDRTVGRVIELVMEGAERLQKVPAE
jgi:2-phosphoglycerate kinase